MSDETTAAPEPFAGLESIKDAPIAPAHAIAALALNMAIKYHDMSIIKDGTLYQQYKLEGRNISPMDLDLVFETAIKMEMFLLGASDRIAKLIVDAIQIEVVDDKEPEEPAPFICTEETPWTAAVTEKMTLHPAARQPTEGDGMPPTVERFCPICSYAWIKEPPQ